MEKIHICIFLHFIVGCNFCLTLLINFSAGSDPAAPL